MRDELNRLKIQNKPHSIIKVVLSKLKIRYNQIDYHFRIFDPTYPLQDLRVESLTEVK